MHVLVVVASRHHATYEIGNRIAATLAAAGLTADLRRPEEVHDLAGYDAVILGSAVYDGAWLASASGLVDRLLPALLERPVWLFSSGPIDGPTAPAVAPAVVAALVERLRPREHRVLAGRLEPDELRLGERVALGRVGPTAGDARDWPAVEGWAREIATTLEHEATAVVPG